MKNQVGETRTKLYLPDNLIQKAKKINEIKENYGKLGEDNDFDIKFWQNQGEKKIFEAVYEMINDYLTIRGKNAHQPRLQRTVESFQKA